MGHATPAPARRQPRRRAAAPDAATRARGAGQARREQADARAQAALDSAQRQAADAPAALDGGAADGATAGADPAAWPRYLDAAGAASPPDAADGLYTPMPPLASGAQAPRYAQPSPAGATAATGGDHTPAPPLESRMEDEAADTPATADEAEAQAGEGAGGGQDASAGADGLEGEAEAGEGADGDAEAAAEPGTAQDGAGGDGASGAVAAADGGQADGGQAAVPDVALIDEELAEHERWAGSFGDLGTAGSDQRARFLLDQAGQGATAGARGGATMGFVMGAIGAAVGEVAGRRLATLAVSRGAKATPVPGLGAAIGGVMAVAGLAMRDWKATGETIGRIGEGQGYERLANDLEGIAEVLDVACSVMDVLAGVLGGIAVGMWVGAVLSAGALSPLAATLTTIATGINLATTAIGVVISVVVRPVVTALRALHAFESQGNPSQIEADGLQLQGAAGQVTGAAAGALAGRLGGAAGKRGGARLDQAGTRLQARLGQGGRPRMSAQAGPGPRVHLEVPEAPPRAPAADAAATPPGTHAAPADAAAAGSTTTSGTTTSSTTTSGSSTSTAVDAGPTSGRGTGAVDASPPSSGATAAADAAPPSGTSATAGGAGTAPARPRPASPGAAPGAAPSAPTAPARPPEDFSDLAGVVADLNADPTVAAKLTDTRAPVAPRATPWGPGQARAYANKQAAAHRDATGMSGAEVQAGHTAAARHAKESGIAEADWDRQPMMDLHSRRGQGLDVQVTDPHTGQTSTRTRHTSQERLIDAAVANVRDRQGGTLTPQGQLDAAAQVAWMTENTPYRQGDVDRLRGSGRAKADAGPAVDPATGRVIKPAAPASAPGAAAPAARSPGAGGGPSASGTTASGGGATPGGGTTPHAPVVHASNTETARTSNRADAMAQYHAQVSADPARESGVWRGADGTYYVMQGDAGSVAPPSVAGPLELIYHSHPTQADVAMQNLVTQPSQAAGDFGVLQYQHGQGTPGARQSSQLHFPTYDAAGNHTGFGATTFAYDPTHPLPLQVQTTLPGGKPSTQRYASFADYQQRTGIHAGGATPHDSAAARAAADTQLQSDQATARQRVDATAAALAGAPVRPSVRDARAAGERAAEAPGGAGGGGDASAAASPAAAPGAGGEAATGLHAGPAYTASVAGMQPGETLELPISPAYPEPPGTVAELDALREQARSAREAQRALWSTEHEMDAQAQQQQAHAQALDEAQGVADGLADGRTEHQAAVDQTQQTNAQQQSTAGQAISDLGRSAQEGAALVTLVGSLRVFQGMADLFSYLPGELGADAERASADAGGLITSLNRVNDTEAVQGSVEEGQGVMEEDAQRIAGVATEGQATDEALAQGQSDVTALTQLNAERMAETQATGQQAGRERRAAADSEAESQGQHDELLGQLQSWAQLHQQAREQAIAQAVAQYEAQGFNAQPLA